MMIQTHPANGVSDLAPIFAKAQGSDPHDRKVYQDFRDRAAYVYATGTFPTHLRTFFTGLLRKATRYTTEKTSIDLRHGSMLMDQKVIDTMDLDHHPMVKKVTDRRPFSKVFLFKQKGRIATNQITVQIDGSVLEGWGSH